MPTYGYHCHACGHNFDDFQSIMAKPLKKCPQCGKLKLHRDFGTGAAVLFKGSGFYRTDYRSESYKASAKAEQDGGKPKTAAKDSTTGTESTAGDGSAAKSSKAKGKSSRPATRPTDG